MCHDKLFEEHALSDLFRTERGACSRNPFPMTRRMTVGPGIRGLAFPRTAGAGEPSRGPPRRSPPWACPDRPRRAQRGQLTPPARGYTPAAGTADVTLLQAGTL